jgi:ABC-2 type transport system permease protein
MSATADETVRPLAQEALQAALVARERPAPPGAVAACRAFAWRGLLKIKHVPEQLIDATVTPVLFLLMFTYLFGGAVEGSTDAYLQYILPGVFVQSVVFTAVYSGVALNTDMTKGVVDRFRTLPVWRAAPLVGAVAGDSMRFFLAGAITLILGLALGYDAGGGVPGIVGAMLLVVFFAFALSWIFTTLGLIMRSPNAVLNTGFMALFPLVFLSNTFVEPETLPAALEAFVNVNPVSHVVTGVRGLLEGTTDWGDIALVLAEGSGLTLVFGALTVRLYRR